jgi:hypothetical protein
MSTLLASASGTSGWKGACETRILTATPPPPEFTPHRTAGPGRPSVPPGRPRPRGRAANRRHARETRVGPPGKQPRLLSGCPSPPAAVHPPSEEASGAVPATPRTTLHACPRRTGRCGSDGKLGAGGRGVLEELDAGGASRAGSVPCGRRGRGRSPGPREERPHAESWVESAGKPIVKPGCSGRANRIPGARMPPACSQTYPTTDPAPGPSPAPREATRRRPAPGHLGTPPPALPASRPTGCPGSVPPRARRGPGISRTGHRIECARFPVA